MMKFYDSDLASDNPINIHSDHEPPKDKIKDKKLLKKTPLRRFHKILVRVRIIIIFLFIFSSLKINLQTGSALPKPAKYDEVSCRSI